MRLNFLQPKRCYTTLLRNFITGILSLNFRTFVKHFHIIYVHVSKIKPASFLYSLPSSQVIPLHPSSHSRDIVYKTFSRTKERKKNLNAPIRKTTVCLANLLLRSRRTHSIPLYIARLHPCTYSSTLRTTRRRRPRVISSRCFRARFPSLSSSQSHTIIENEMLGRYAQVRWTCSRVNNRNS